MIRQILKEIYNLGCYHGSAARPGHIDAMGIEEVIDEKCDKIKGLRDSFSGKKSDLKNDGSEILEYKSNERRLLKDMTFYDSRGDRSNHLNKYNEDLIHCDESDLDIVKTYTLSWEIPTEAETLLKEYWEREELRGLKPPLGIVPKGIWEEYRYNELKSAINRYVKAGKDIPAEWAKEVFELLGDPDIKISSVT